MLNVFEWLLEEENPSVRYLTLILLSGKSVSDHEVAEAKKAIMQRGAVPEILALQNEDGSWGAPDRFYRDKYRGTVWNLLLLAELEADPEDPRVKRACNFILSNSQEPEEGGFSYDRSAKTGSGLASGVIPCLTGNMTFSLIKLGFAEDVRVRRAVEWIIKYQRADDGDEGPPSGDYYKRYEMCWGSHSCHMGVAKALKALSVVPETLRSSGYDEKLSELAEYFLKHHIYKKSHDLSAVAKPGWLKPGFPLMYQTDILELLYIFSELKLRDERLNDALDILRSRQLPDGRWKLENSFNGKTSIRIEKKGMPSKWITLKALKVLKEYGE